MFISLDYDMREWLHSDACQVRASQLPVVNTENLTQFSSGFKTVGFSGHGCGGISASSSNGHSSDIVRTRPSPATVLVGRKGEAAGRVGVGIVRGHSGGGMQCFLCCFVKYDNCNFLILLWDPVLVLWLKHIGIVQLAASSVLSA